MNLKRQLQNWYALEFLSNFSIHEGVSVVFLLLRGFTLFDFGIAEGFFHVTSLLFEVPSGMLADVLGRKKLMVMSQAAFLVFALLMAFSTSLLGIILAFCFCALAYNMQSGTREAICYDSLAEQGREGEFLRVMSNGSVLYSVAGTVGNLCSGIALAIGYTLAYLVKAVIAGAGVLVALFLKEPKVSEGRMKRFSFPVLGKNIKRQFLSAFSFLKGSPDALKIMAVSALVGCVKVLSLFYIQELLSAVSGGYIGFCLVFISLGPVAGAKLALVFDKKLRLSTGFFWCAFLTAAGVALATLMDHFLFMIIGGFLVSAFETLINLLATGALNALIPSDARATLMSASAMVFSLMMLPLSPLTGFIANAYSTDVSFLCMAGLLFALAAFILIYKARKKKAA